MPRLLHACLLTLQLCLFNQVAYAQHWQWVKSSEGTVIVVSYGIIVDASGNSYVTGYFTEKEALSSTTLISSDQEDVFLVKYNAAGEVLWAKSYGGTGRDYGFSIVLDKQGNIFITGGIKIAGILLNKSDIFVSKYDNTGNLIWTLPRKNGHTLQAG